MRCSPCPATTSVWLHALTGSTGVLPVLGFSGPSDYGSSGLRPSCRARQSALLAMPCQDFRLAFCSDRLHWSVTGLGLFGSLGLWSPRIPAHHVVLYETPCTPCPATTSVGLPALAGTNGLLPVLCSSRISRVLRFPRISVLYVVVAMPRHASQAMPCHNLRLASSSDRRRWDVLYGLLGLVGFLGFFEFLGSPSSVVPRHASPCLPRHSTTSVWLPALTGATGVLTVL